jgi:ribonuclease P protein component
MSDKITSIVTLKKRAQFVMLSKKGSHVATKGLVLLSLDKATVCPYHAQDAHIYVGFTATKKIGNAVVRNRVKRRLRALVKECLPKRADPTKAYVLIARYHTKDRPFDSLKKDLLYALHHTAAHR